jgi:hypothetical protein
MAKFHDYRNNTDNSEILDISAHWTGEEINIVLDEFLFITISPEEARAVIKSLHNSINDFKEYAAGV